MPSVHPEYEYDIFISYRQNDNLDGWVTRFVEALDKELKATLKNEVSIYFDENPHDGLLETHQVDASLAKKLKCLIFIPIISQTYCDENCFAWEHEFMPFINMAKEDELGMNVTLSNGNVTSRVLPVKIHDLDSEDQDTLEAVLDGPLRCIEFIYQEPGVNRPLRVNEIKPTSNLNNTVYRDQMNKVANSLKDIGISILRAGEIDISDLPQDSNTDARPSPTPHNKSNSKKKLLIPLSFVAILALAFFLLKPLLFKNKEVKNISEVGLAIMPFKNIADNPDINVLSFALKDNVQDVLSLSKKFAFLSSSQATSSYAGKNLAPQIIGQELGVDYVLLGSYQLSGDKLNVRVEFADTGTGNSVWSDNITVKYEEANLLPMQADIAQKVLAIFNKTDDNVTLNSGTINLDSYSHYINGLEWMKKGRRKETMLRAIEEFEQAIRLDSSHTLSWIKLIECKSNLLFHDLVSDTVYLPQIEENIKVLSDNHPQWSVDLANGIYQYYVLGNYDNGFEYFKAVLEKYPDNELANDLTASIYMRKLDIPLSFQYRMKTINLNPQNPRDWAQLGLLFYINGDDKRALRSCLKAVELGLDSTYFSIPDFRIAGVPFDSIPQQFLPTNTNRFESYKLFYYNNPQEIIAGLKKWANLTLLAGQTITPKPNITMIWL